MQGAWTGIQQGMDGPSQEFLLWKSFHFPKRCILSLNKLDKASPPILRA